jgi:flagellar hook-associated protein 1
LTIPSSTGLETALRGLLAYQAAVDTTGHNIANANTPGYSRQTAELTESPSLVIPGYSATGGGVQLGTGVDLSAISRIRDQFLDNQYRTQNSLENKASEQSTVLEQVQTAIAEPSDHGLESQLSAFWNAWSDFSNSPQSQAAWQSVQDAGTTLAGTLNGIQQQLQQVQSDSSSEYSTLTSVPDGQVYTDATQIASLNGEISEAVASGQSPNDLEDQRDNLIDDLSSLANVQVTDQGNGMVNVQFGDAAQPLVNGNAAPDWPQTLTSPGGKLGALLGLSDPTSGTIQGYLNTLTGISNSLVSSVTGTAGAAFFDNSSGSLAVSSGLNITDFSGSAQTISDLRGGTIDQNYASFVTQVGSDAQSAQNTQQTQQSLLTAIDNQRQSVSGVSLDEEMTNLISFQRGYQASARMMTTIDGMLDTLINHTGTVGL